MFGIDAIREQFHSDPVLEHLDLALRAASNVEAERSGLYSDAVRHANAARQSILRHAPEAAPGGDAGAARGGLATWRLRRVIAFVDANLAEPVNLFDMAAAAGYSPMYFAARFRASTGMRPHAFLVRRRIELACRLLRETNDRLVEIALASGFQTQPHFTTVFKRLLGETPHRWRSRQPVPERPPG